MAELGMGYKPGEWEKMKQLYRELYHINTTHRVDIEAWIEGLRHEV